MPDGQQDSIHTNCEKPEGIVVKNKDSRCQGSNQDQLSKFGHVSLPFCTSVFLPEN